MGKVVAFNMVLLPNILFVFFNAIIDIPKLMLTKLQAVLKKFIWDCKRARIKASILQQKIEDRGMAIPNTVRYD